MRKTKTHRGALTLVETAVVVAVSAGAVALGLPTLKQAREAAKLQTCLSNLGQVTKAFIGYTHDRGVIPMITTADGSWASWSFGGWSGRNRAFWEGANPAWNIQTRDRPLSVYMTPWEIAQEVDRLTPTMETPLFKCPSDNRSVQWQWGDVDDDLPCQDNIPAYDDVGTSYQANWHWWYQVSEDHTSEDWDTIVGTYANQMVQRYIAQAPSRFILLIEDPADWGFGAGGPDGAGIQIPGFHGDFSKHTVGFADGSAQYLYLDSRHAHDSIPNPPGPRHGKYSNLGTWSVVDWQNDHAGSGRHY